MNERLLYQKLKNIFHSDVIHENVKKQLNIKYPSTGAYMEFDIWIPKFHLCFEFQDSYHYISAWYHHDTKEYIQTKDNVKKGIAQQRGITLLTIPCWWDGTEEKLISSIQFVRPDIVLDPNISVLPIDLNPPHDFFPENEVPLVGELMLASFPKHHQFNEGGFKWWIGEKYDGVRFCWNPVDKIAYTRSGNQLSFLPYVSRLLPNEFVDNEAWFGRGQFAKTYMLISNSNIDEISPDISAWAYLRVLSFDIAAPRLQNEPFEDRYTTLLSIIEKQNPLNIIVARALHKSRKSLNDFVQSVINNEGEGLILRKHGSLYEHGRSQSLIKLKALLEDKEAIVVGHGEDSSVILKLPSGTTFTVPEKQVLIENLEKGDIVTFSFESYSRRDTPVNPKIFRIRKDLSWEDILHSFYKENKGVYVSGFTQHPQGYWSLKNRRKLMERIATNKNMDPLVPENWYNSLSKDFFATEKAQSILRYHKNNPVQVVIDLFPDIGLDKSKFLYYQRSKQTVEQRREFFEKYARDHNFDAQDPAMWYLQSRKKIMGVKGAIALLRYYDDNIPKALSQLFPNIGLDLSKFPKINRMWNHAQSRKEFFLTYAKDRGFNPLIPENWYSQTKEQILSAKGASRVLTYHNSSISKALMDLFPNLGLDPDKFRNYYNNLTAQREREKRRKFFENYAKEQNFDYKDKETWYSQSLEKILAVPGGSTALRHYNKSISSALLDLFPDIGLDKSKFHGAHTWNSIENRRQFFEKYAKENNFDPTIADNWYNQSRTKILSLQKAKVLLKRYNNNVPFALLDVFPNIGIELHKFQDSMLQKRGDLTKNVT